MDVKKKKEKKEDTKEELDLTKVAESFGGDIVEVTRITGDNYKKIVKNIKQGELLDPDTTPVGTKNTPVSTKKKRGPVKGSKNKSKSPVKQLELNTKTPKVKQSSGIKTQIPSGSPEMGGESKKFVKNRRTPLKTKNVSVSDKNLQRI